MKKIYLLTLLVFTGAFASAQIVDQFSYTGALDANGWVHQSGSTTGELLSITSASDNGSSLSFAGLPASVGNRMAISSTLTQDVNKVVTGISGTGYYSMLIKVTNTTGLNTTGAYFAGFAATAGAGASVFGGKLYIKSGTAGHFLLGIQATNGTAAFSATELSINTTYFVVVKETANTNADLFINPVPGAAEPAPSVSQSGSGTFGAFASLFIRQATGTGNIEIDEIRAGSTWASVTPSGCATVNNFSATACGSYTLNSTVYTTSGLHTQVLPNANSQGCDSTINLTLTINQPTTSTLNETACTSYTLNGQTYTTTGVYTQVLPGANANGCDSTITLNLTITTSVTYYQDFDTDGFGNAAVTTTGCVAPPGYVTNDDDCDDNNNAIGVATVTYYQDFDTDGFGNAAVSTVACTQPGGYVTNDDDCDDNNNAAGAATNWYPDVDLDGYGSASASAVVACAAPPNHVSSHTDCNDNNNAVHPGATEIPDNGVDEDCSGADLSTALGMYEFTAVGACPVTAVDVTAQPSNATFGPYTTAGTICASANNVFNNNDWNTTTTIDPAEYNQFYITPADCYEMDLTNLNFDHKISGSGGTPFIHVRSSVDNFAADIYSVQLMNDVLTNVNFALPAAFEGLTDTVYFRIYVTQMGASGATYRHDNVRLSGSLSALSTQTYYADTDGDGFGNPASSVTDCETPAGYVSDNTDCDDTNADEFPGAVWYLDNDTDGFGNPAVSLTQCTQPAGYVADNTDCNDNNSAVGAEIAFYVDADTDGFGEAGSAALMACTPPAGYVTNDDDCDDDDDEVFPGATEICDGIDNNCDGNTDEGLAVSVWYEDADGDTFGNEDESVSDCAQPVGYVANSTDCDDDNAAVHPGATDVANNTIDENCDGVDGYLALDENVFGSVSVFPNPGTTEVTVKMSAIVSGAKAQLISAEGKMISEQLVSEGETVIGTSALLPGVYFIKISNASSSTVIRWIKK